MGGRKEPTIQRSISWPQSMYEAIERQAEARGIPLSAYIRFATEKQLREDGEEVRDNLMWGGYRYSADEEQESGEMMAVAVE